MNGVAELFLKSIKQMSATPPPHYTHAHKDAHTTNTHARAHTQKEEHINTHHTLTDTAHTQTTHTRAAPSVPTSVFRNPSTQLQESCLLRKKKTRTHTRNVGEQSELQDLKDPFCLTCFLRIHEAYHASPKTCKTTLKLCFIGPLNPFKGL